jgi:methionyl-tRNA formyltransferase
MTKRALRVIFAGTPEFAALHLQHLVESEHQLAAVYTQPDRRAGRGRQLRASPVKRVAEAAGLAVYQPHSLREDAVQMQVAGLGADVMVVVAYGLILPPAVLDATRLGCVNVHASLLPRWRGAAPIQRAIEAGDTTTGITIMQMDAGLDTGDMLGAASCEIGPRTTAADLQERLARLGPPLLLDVLGDIERRRNNRQPQDEGEACYAHKVHKAEAELDWRLGATALDRKVRAFNPSPVCYTFIEGRRVRVWQSSPVPSGTTTESPGTIVRTGEEGIVVRCGEDDLALESLQLEGGRALTAAQLLGAHGSRFVPGGRFTLPVAAAGG